VQRGWLSLTSTEKLTKQVKGATSDIKGEHDMADPF